MKNEKCNTTLPASLTRIYKPKTTWAKITELDSSVRELLFPKQEPA
jgi:hypothetical protein